MFVLVQDEDLYRCRLEEASTSGLLKDLATFEDEEIVVQIGENIPSIYNYLLYLKGEEIKNADPYNDIQVGIFFDDIPFIQKNVEAFLQLKQLEMKRMKTFPNMILSFLLTNDIIPPELPKQGIGREVSEAVKKDVEKKMIAWCMRKPKDREFTYRNIRYTITQSTPFSDILVEDLSNNIVTRYTSRDDGIDVLIEHTSREKNKLIVNHTSKFFFLNGTYLTTSIFRTVDGMKDGEAKLWRDNGQLESIINYKRGLLDGKYQTWYENGQQYILCFYKDSMLQGLCKTWYRNGKKKETYHCTSNSWNGKRTTWHDNGRVNEIGYFNYNLQEGKHKTWYRNGNVKSVHNYKNGKANGKWRDWFEEGGRLKVCFYKNDMLDGVYKIYYPDGKLQQLCFYKNGKLDGEFKKWYENQQLEELSRYENGSLINKRLWYDDGKIKM